MPIRLDTTRSVRAWIDQRARTAPPRRQQLFERVSLEPSNRRPCGCYVDVAVFGHTSCPLTPPYH